MSEKETACLRDITETDIMEYMQVEHPHNEKELWKMKHATPARIGIGRCGARYTTEAQLRFLAAHAAANDAVFNEVPEEVVKELGVFEVRTKCSNKNEMLLRPDWGREFLPDARQKIAENCVHHPQVQIYFGDGLCSPSIKANIPDLFPTIKMGLEDKEDYYPYQLSGGQCQRVAIARALALNPKILFFDEPTSALDPELVGEVLDTIKKAANEGYTMLLVSHEMNFVKNVATRVIFLENGKIIEDGPPKEVFNHPKSDRVREFFAKINRMVEPEYSI